MESENLELVWIQLFGIYSRPMLLGTCYRPPQFDQTFFELLNQNIDKVVMHDLLLMGDFNAKHSCWNDKDMTNRPGALLKDLLDSFNLDQLCSKPSHLHSSGRPESLLDLAITNVPECFLPPRTLEPLSTSDHLPIILEIKNNNNKFFPRPISDPSPSKHYLFGQKNSDAMLEAFTSPVWTEIFSSTDINEVWLKWKNQFFAEIEDFIPTKDNTKNCNRHKNAPWFTKNLRGLTREKNRLYKLALRSKKPDDWIKYCAVRNKTSNAVRAAKYRFINKKASRLANPACTVTTWWRTARDICGFKPPTHADIPPLLDKATGIHLSEDVDKANLLNDTYVNENTSLNPTAFSYGPTQTQTVFSIKSFSEVEVFGVIQSLPNKLSTGADKISYRLLKEAGPGLISPLTALFNRSVDAGEVPDEWKAAEITPVFKGGNKDRRMPSNYRPIALTCCIARVLEKLINKRLLSYLIQHKILYQHQSGFLPKHSTTSQLCFLLHKWHAALERGNSAHIAFLDLSKAYDRVSIAGLIYKLSQIGLSVPTLKWFSSFLTAREQCVKINGQKSQWLKLKSGIPQGTVLGPTLFLLFINDLPVNLSEDCSIFADDTTAYSIGGSSEETAQALSSDLQKAHDWATTWGMLFNAEKSKHLMVVDKSRLTPAPRVNMNGVTLPTCTTHKHLGITLNSSLTWQDHINSIYSTCARQVGILARLRNVLTKATGKKYTLNLSVLAWNMQAPSGAAETSRSFRNCRTHSPSATR